jgi:hypothetical protein
MDSEKTLADLVADIEQELRRLGVAATDSNPTGACVCADAMLPCGWVRVADDTVEACGEAGEILAALQGAGAGESEAAWQALYRFGKAPQNSQDWPGELITIEQIEEGSINDDPAHVIKISTNSGERYTCGPHGVAHCAVSEAFQFGDWHASRQEAVAAWKTGAATGNCEEGEV